MNVVYRVENEKIEFVYVTVFCVDLVEKFSVLLRNATRLVNIITLTPADEEYQVMSIDNDYS